MSENTRGQRNSSEDQGQNSEKDKNREQNTSNQEQQSRVNESRQVSGRSFNSPGINDERDQTGLNQGGQNASANTGGTTDIQNESLTGKGRNSSSEKGSGITTKRNVTGSDYDGQVTDD